MNEVMLTGCRPTPLASYLKALAVFRLVAEQVDSEARGFWRDDTFVLQSELDEEGLLEFFREQYHPTPVLNPWGGRSGFYSGSSEKSAREALQTINRSTIERLKEFRDVIVAARKVLEELGFREKPKDEDALSVLRALRNRLPDNALQWMDAVCVLTADGRKFPPLMGTGGNEGSGSYTSGYAQAVAELVLEDARPQALASSLFAISVPGSRFSGQTPGQFDPGRAGGANQSTGIFGKTKINLWDYVLQFEGALLFSAAAARKLNQSHTSTEAYPFMVLPSGVGYASSSSADEEKPRSEFWTPIWSKPASLGEIQGMLAEGRASLGRRQARDGLDFARAVSILGVDRGIDGFERFIFLERRGKGYFVAMPAGRLPVRFEPSVRLLDDLDPILSKVDRFLRGFKNVPATFESARRRIDDAIFNCSVEPRAERFGDVVCALGRLERLIALRDRQKDPERPSPLSGLRPQWIAMCDDGGPEVRIAAALASIRSTGKVGPIRANLAGVDPSAPWQWATGKSQARYYGNSLVERLASVIEQRMMDAERLSAPTVPIEGLVQLSPYDVCPFLLGDTDDLRLEETLWGLTLVAWQGSGLDEVRERWKQPIDKHPLPRGFAAIKLVFSPGKVREKRLGWEPRIPSLLRAGRTGEAVNLAHKRLRVSDLRPLPVEADDWIDPRRQLAALLVPVRNRRLLETLVLEQQKESEASFS